MRFDVVFERFYCIPLRDAAGPRPAGLVAYKASTEAITACSSLRRSGHSMSGCMADFQYATPKRAADF